jgi:tRNA threonylcarbamoyladenosine biosynthesis protein TsaE
VPSPTFNLVQTYPLYCSNNNEIWHCDFYRLNEYEEVEEIGVFEDIKKK